MRKFPRSHWIKRPSLWCCIGALLVCFLSLSQWTVVAYTPSILANATIVFYIIIPAMAVAVAWEASRFRPVIGIAANSVRKILLDRLLWFALFPPLAYTASVIFLAGNLTALNSSLFIGMLGYSCILGIGWVVVGTVIGFSLRPAISVGLAGVLSYGWYALLPSMISPGAIRRLSGDFLACCSLDADLDRRAVVIAGGVILGVSMLSIALFSLIKMQSSKTLPVMACCAGVALIVISAVANHSLTDNGLIARNRADLVCIDGVSAWPEIPKDSIALNARAREKLAEIIPNEWSEYATAPVVWGETDDQSSIEFSGQRTLPGVLGDYVDYVGSIELARTGVEICGTPLEKIGIVRSGLAWNPEELVSIEAVEHRLEHSLCPTRL